LQSDILQLEDYLLATYKNGQSEVDVYYAYTESQRKGFVPHSPKACIPGGGWEISDASIHNIQINENKSLKLTRLLITKGQSKHVVYYWFHQRGRDLPSEFPMKFALLYDSVMKNRTDGALVRFITSAEQSEKVADETLAAFIRLSYPLFADYIPS